MVCENEIDSDKYVAVEVSGYSDVSNTWKSLVAANLSTGNGYEIRRPRTKKTERVLHG